VIYLAVGIAVLVQQTILMWTPRRCFFWFFVLIVCRSNWAKMWMVFVKKFVAAS